MKKLLILLFPLALACGNAEPGPSPEPSPVPTPRPCVTTGIVNEAGPVYQGDCVHNSECHDTGDGFSAGECETRK